MGTASDHNRSGIQDLNKRVTDLETDIASINKGLCELVEELKELLSPLSPFEIRLGDGKGWERYA